MALLAAGAWPAAPECVCARLCLWRAGCRRAGGMRGGSILLAAAPRSVRVQSGARPRRGAARGQGPCLLSVQRCEGTLGTLQLPFVPPRRLRRRNARLAVLSRGAARAALRAEGRGRHATFAGQPAVPPSAALRQLAASSDVGRQLRQGAGWSRCVDHRRSSPHALLRWTTDWRGVARWLFSGRWGTSGAWGLGGRSWAAACTHGRTHACSRNTHAHTHTCAHTHTQSRNASRFRRVWWRALAWC